MLNSVREDTAMVTALLGLGCKSKADNCLQQLWTTNNLFYVVRCAALLSLAYWRTIYTASELRDALERARFQCRQLSLIIVYVLSSLSRLYHCRYRMRETLLSFTACIHKQSLTGRGFFAVFKLSNNALTAAQSFSSLLSKLDCAPLSVPSCLLILLLFRGTELLRPASLRCAS